MFPSETGQPGSEKEMAEDVFISIQAFPALLDIPDVSEVSRVSCGSRHTAAVSCKLGHSNCLSDRHVKSSDGSEMLSLQQFFLSPFYW